MTHQNFALFCNIELYLLFQFQLAQIHYSKILDQLFKLFLVLGLDFSSGKNVSFEYAEHALSIYIDSQMSTTTEFAKKIKR